MPATATTYRSVRVGYGKRVHARSPKKPQQTVCGLEHRLIETRFTPTEEPVNCPVCLHFITPRPTP